MQSEKAQEEISFFGGFGGPADIMESMYWEVCSEHLSTSHLLHFAALIIFIIV